MVEWILLAHSACSSNVPADMSGACYQGLASSLDACILLSQEVSKQLPDEAKKRRKAVAEATAALKSDADTRNSMETTKYKPSQILLESCVLPRVLYSPEDAMHCSVIILQAFRLFSFNTSYLGYVRTVRLDQMSLKIASPCLAKTANSNMALELDLSPINSLCVKCTKGLDVPCIVSINYWPLFGGMLRCICMTCLRCRGKSIFSAMPTCLAGDFRQSLVDLTGGRELFNHHLMLRTMGSS